MPSINLNEGQQLLLAAVVKVVKLNIDWNQVAEEMNGTTTASKAKANWGYLRGKLVAGADDTAGAKPATKKRKSSDEGDAPVSKKGKKKTPPKVDEDDGKDGGLITAESDDEDLV